MSRYSKPRGHPDPSRCSLAPSLWYPNGCSWIDDWIAKTGQVGDLTRLVIPHFSPSVSILLPPDGFPRFTTASYWYVSKCSHAASDLGWYGDDSKASKASKDATYDSIFFRDWLAVCQPQLYYTLHPAHCAMHTCACDTTHCATCTLVLCTHMHVGTTHYTL